MYYRLKYIHWNEDGKAHETLQERSVSQEELFVRKLVDSTILNNKLYHHLSHESDDQEGDFIYVLPFDRTMIVDYGSSIQSTVQSLAKESFPSRSERLSYYLWSGSEFTEPQLLLPTPVFQKDISAYLLNHYLVFGGTAYEIVSSVFDPERDRVLLFIKEAESDEQ